MSARPSLQPPAATHEIRFDSLFTVGRGLSFPCDADGWVVVDRLTERERLNYLAARALVGREYAAPRVLMRQVLLNAA